ncbi:SDR family NAD(P)-dependent oxidoreductase [Hymenobacter sp. ASUV-10]|uniref:SDR family NAD(P)-dependent oxidoreductase n=1 Tax=Hymenobacter aranciens TaxID=3063996 RepID=A0ABT9BCU2_9BACT|nr:SDR family NAD(P)-dependent oxidoreductase [Hymenobacter sp. ASUV-10]MDO7874363.1 SDR family NAD(P)-dependent oxidoreductase [Hymenobacter sp. ASUV-10]
MARIFITGSANGLGQLAARQLVRQQHQVVLHARSPARAADAQAAVPEAESVVMGDLSTLAGMRQVAEQANALGHFDAVIHNAGVYQVPQLVRTADGWPAPLAINTLAPYVLTCLMERPTRLVYLSSGMHRQGDASLQDLLWQQRPWNTMQAYCDSKLHDLLLSNAVARHWPEVLVNAVDPGWVPTKMGGVGAPDSLVEGARTQAWLAAGTDPAAHLTGQYLHHQRPSAAHPQAADVAVQEQLLAECARLTGVAFPLGT